MTYCTTADLVNLTGSTRTTTQLQAIIDEADREVNAYLKARGVSGSTCDELKSVSLKLSKAGLLEFGLQNGDFEADSGDFTSSVDVTRAVESLRAAARRQMDDFIATQVSLSTPRRIYVMRVR